MSDAALSIALPSASTHRTDIAATAVSFIGSIAKAVRKRWIYQQTLADLERYSQRSLLDIGADRGIDEFARRAARL